MFTCAASTTNWSFLWCSIEKHMSCSTVMEESETLDCVLILYVSASVELYWGSQHTAKCCGQTSWAQLPLVLLQLLGMKHKSQLSCSLSAQDRDGVRCWVQAETRQVFIHVEMRQSTNGRFSLNYEWEVVTGAFTGISQQFEWEYHGKVRLFQ